MDLLARFKADNCEYDIEQLKARMEALEKELKELKQEKEAKRPVVIMTSWFNSWISSFR